MRIAIDLSAVRTKGTKVWCAGFLPALARIAVDDEFLIFIPPEVEQQLGTALPSNFVRRVTGVSHSVGLRVLWEQFVLPGYLRAWRPDVLFAPFDIAPFAAPCPVLLAVRNPSMLLRLKLSDFPVQGQRLLAYLSCRKARLVFFPSLYASKRLGDVMRVPPAKREVVYHGTNHGAWATIHSPAPVLDRYELKSGRYILFVSQFYRYKQPDVLIEAFAKWRASTNQMPFKLVLVGGSHDKAFGQQLRKQANELGLGQVALFLDNVSPTDLATLYQQAAAFVLPTIMETFGQPFVEAMASGAPVICADTEFARELCGPAAVYFPAGDPGELAQSLEQVIGQSPLRERMKEAGYQRAASFSWDREASETYALLRRLDKAPAAATIPLGR